MGNLSEEQDEADREEADREGFGVEVAGVAEDVDRREEEDLVSPGFVAGEVSELPEDDEEASSGDESGEDGVRYESGQAAGPDEAQRELEDPDEECQDEEGGGDLCLRDGDEDRVDRYREYV